NKEVIQGANVAKGVTVLASISSLLIEEGGEAAVGLVSETRLATSASTSR
ncbi:hypothetical protein BgiMline_030132, partial [Biomphalaria glabrata]